MGGLLALPFLGVIASAQTAYFDMPATFEADSQATIVGVVGAIITVLAVMWAVRKTIKTVNRS